MPEIVTSVAQRRPDDGIVLDGLEKWYGDVAAVRRVDLSVARGEFVAILGASGAGKTTLLSMLTGFEKPTAGEIRIDGKNIARLAPSKRNLGVVFQHYALFPHMTVYENVGFALRMRRMKPAQQRALIDDALRLVKLEKLADRFPKQLSGGQQQRVALARATVFKPSVLVMDEPLGALDKNLREHMRIEIKQLQRQLGATVLYVTHDQNEALTMADRVVVMNDGRVEQVGTPQDLYERSATRFVAGFVGEMNFLRATASRIGPDSIEIVLPEGKSALVGCPADPSEQIEAGDQVVLALRPEWLSVVPFEGLEGSGRIDGLVEEVLYEGSSLTSVIRTPSGVLTARTSLHPMESTILAVGSRVTVDWPDALGRVYRD